MKKGFLNFLLLASVFSYFPMSYAADAGQPVTTGFSKAQQQNLTPEAALKLLKEGNQRFVENKGKTFDFSKIRKNTAQGQHPFAVVVSCLDSRSAPDITLNQGLGNIFVGRVAGNVVDKNLLGSMEFATKHVGSKLIVVMGHTDCGAIVGACAQAGNHNLRHLLKNLEPAVKQVSQKEGKNCQSMKFINDVARQNVIDQVNDIYKDSKTIRKLVNEHKVMLVGAMHNLATGKVNFFYTFKPEKKS